MRSILNGSVSHDLHTSIDSPRDHTRHNVVNEGPRPVTAVSELIEAGPVTHTVDAKLMTAMQKDHSALYRTHFSGLEVSGGKYAYLCECLG